MVTRESTDLEIYHDGRGWRIAVSQTSGRIALDRSQAKLLIDKLRIALDRITDKDG